LFHTFAYILALIHSLVCLLLDDLDEVLHHIPSPLMYQHCKRQVPQQMLCIDLYSSQVWRAHKQINEVIPPILMVEEHEECPVEKPCTLLKLLEGYCERLVVNGLLDLVDGVAGKLKVLSRSGMGGASISAP
jgi:hypothetical protein